MSCFGRLRHLPHPVPGEDGHYLTFSEVFKMNTTGEFCPFLQKKTSKCRALPLYASVQHVKNCQLML